jgi:hypothetical protein
MQETVGARLVLRPPAHAGVRVEAGGIHVYGGDSFDTKRSQWDPETLAEGPSDGDVIRAIFRGAMPDTPSAHVASDGTFVLERMQPGSYTLAVLDPPPGFALAPRAGVHAGSTGVELVLAPSTTIEGRVVDEDRKPVREARVYFFAAGVVNARNSFADADGRFRIEVAPGVVGKLGATHPDRLWCQAHRMDVVAGTTDITLELKTPESHRAK